VHDLDLKPAQTARRAAAISAGPCVTSGAYAIASARLATMSRAEWTPLVFGADKPTSVV